MRVNELAHIPLSFPTYAGILTRVAASAARKLNFEVNWQANQTETAWLGSEKTKIGAGKES
jgi:hypothetical protein